MSFSSQLIAIESRFNSLWITSDADVVYGNIQYDPQNNPWVRLTVQHGETKRASVWPEYYRTSGIIFTQVFVRANRGVKMAMILADKVGDIWRAQQFSSIHCLSPSVVDVGINNGWYQVNVVCPFYHDELLPTI